MISDDFTNNWGDLTIFHQQKLGGWKDLNSRSSVVIPGMSKIWEARCLLSLGRVRNLLRSWGSKGNPHESPIKVLKNRGFCHVSWGWFILGFTTSPWNMAECRWYIYIYILSMSMGQETGHCDLRSLRHCHRQTSSPPELNDFVVASSQPAGQEALWRAKGEAWEVR